MKKDVQEIRIYPLERFMYPTEEYAKLCIANGFDSYTSIGNLYCLNGGVINLYRRTLFLFQYGGKIIAKGKVNIEKFFWGKGYYLDEIEVLDDGITTKDIKSFYREFKKFNSTAQRIPLTYLSEILNYFEKKKKIENIKLGENESFFCNQAEGNKIEYYVTKYERNPQYREQAIRIHGFSCQICGFNFEEFYGRLGERYIEVHHKKPLYSLKEVIIPNPETDMICVCSNCHRVLHRHKDSVVSPEELKMQLKTKERKNLQKR